MQPSNSLPNVLILGCGRSGTSIFGELFQHLSVYTYVSEPPFSDIMAAQSSGLLAVKVPHESEEFPPTPGLSFPLITLLQHWPNTKLFWIVRHPLDAICSLRPGISNKWGHHPRPPDWQDWLERPLLEQCAHHWQYINTYGFKQVVKRATLVRFEEMIANPEGFARQVCRAIDIALEKDAVELAAWCNRVQDSNNECFIEAETSRNYSRPDHAVRVGRWRENLTAAQANNLWRMVGPTATQFGYQI